MSDTLKITTIEQLSYPGEFFGVKMIETPPYDIRLYDIPRVFNCTECIAFVMV